MLGDGGPGKQVNQSQLFLAQSSSYAEKLTANQEPSNLPVKNRFHLLSPSITCSVNPALFPPLMGFGLAQVRSKSQPINKKDLIWQSQGPSALGRASDRNVSSDFAKSDFPASINHKIKPMSIGPCSKRAQSEPITDFNSSLKGATDFNHFRPKKFNNFTRGKILSWEDFEFHEKRKKEKKAFGARGNPPAKETDSGKCVLKVYSRRKNKRVPITYDLMNLDGDFFGGTMLGNEQNFEEDNQILARPDDTSMSSSSD